METLGHIQSIADKIRTSSRPAIYALYRFVFEKDGDRTSRKQLRAFRGFDFDDTAEEFRAKLEYSTIFSIGDLTSMCNILGLDYTGTKEELRQKILRALMNVETLVPHDDDDDDAEAEEEQHSEESETMENPQRRQRKEIKRISNVGNRRTSDDDISSPSSTDSDDGDRISSKHRRRNKTKITFNFKDVEDTIRSFDGSDCYSVEKWIADFEDLATMFEWNDMQKLVFARKSIQGVAKVFVRGLKVTQSWDMLKAALKEEFGLKVSSADIHRKLAKKKMKNNESLQEYYLAMRELAAQGDIDAESVIQYVIDGIPDSSSKVMLYGARDYNEFRARLRTYEKIQERSLTSSSSGSKGNPKKESSSKLTKDDNRFSKDDQRRTLKTTERCYNCGESGHKSNTCRFKDRGKKCFKCNNFGHESKKCPGKNNPSDVQAATNTLIKTINVSRMFKEILIEDKKFDALLDTGSHLSLMREDKFKLIDTSKLCESQVLLTGIAQGQAKTIGHFQTTITIDGFNFPLTFHVIPSKALDVTVILGTDFINQAEITIDQHGITVNKPSAMVFLSQIKLQSEEDETINTGLTISKGPKNIVENMMLEYKPNKIKTTGIKLGITLKDETPIFQNTRRLPPKEANIVEKQVNDWIDEGIVEPCSSEYASPVVVVKKKDGSPRLCVDYRKINRVMVKDKYPLPNIEEQLDRLAETRIFSTIDLRNGFFHVDVDVHSRKYTAFVTNQGQYWFLKVPFGLCNSPSVFQRFINHIFRPLVNDGILLIYLDDLIIIAPNVEEGINRLQRVLQVASNYGLDINKNKCQLLQSRIEYLGHIIENGKIHPSPNKIQAVLNFPEPHVLKDVQSFLGLSGYFRKFIEFYAIKAKPLSDMLRKENVFQFGCKEKESFEQLKLELSHGPVLRIFNQKFETELHTDACKDGFGAILLQKNPDDDKFHPTYYMSHKTTETESKYTSYELEVLAVIRALEKFRHYLLGIKFKIITDCAAFKQTMRKTKLSAKIARWALLIEEFDATVEHRAGSRMKHVDSLSRYPVMTISNKDNVVIKITNAQENDPELRAIKEVLKSKPYDDYLIRNNVLYKYKDGRELFVVPHEMQNEIIQMAHGKGHFAIKRTEEIIKQEYYVPKLTKKD